MKIYEVISEDIGNAAWAASVPTVQAALGPNLNQPWAQKLLNYGPAVVDAIKSLAVGNVGGAALTTVQAAISDTAKGSEVQAANNWISRLVSANTAAGHLGATASSAMTAATPVAMMAMPYMMAGEEKRKIDADLYNPKFDNNPYAISQRSTKAGKSMTQGQAGAANRRKTIQQFSTAGNPANPQP